MPKKIGSKFAKCPCCARAEFKDVPPPPLPEGYDSTVCTCAPGASAKADFYEYTNADWLQDETITIPADYSRWGSFIILVDQALKTQIGLAKELVSSASTDDEKKLAMVWDASMARFADWDAGRGTDAEMLGELKRLEEALPASAMGAEDDAAFTTGLATYISRCQEVGIGAPMAFGKEANLEDTENILLDLSPGGTSLPSRDYYLDDKFAEQRGWFKEHLGKVVELVGASNLTDDFVNRVARFETKLAQISMKPDQSRQFDQYFNVTTLDALISDVNTLKHLKDKEKNYSENKVDKDADEALLTTPEWTVGDAEKGNFRTFWECMFKCLQLREVLAANYAKNYPEKSDAEAAQYRMMAFDGDYFRRVLCLLLQKSNCKDVKAYFQYKIIKSSKDLSTKALNEEFFDFFARKLGGQKEQKTGEKRSVGLVNSWVGELMGKVYVSRFFSEEDKNTVHGMVKEVLQIMENSLRTNDWLTEATKAKAQQKLAKFVVKLGYPDKLKSFDDLKLSKEDSLFAMQQKVNAFEHQTEFLDKINSVKDKTKWEMNPQDVNAYFHPLNNEIVFPAAIMQPPFYQRSLEVATVANKDELADTKDLLKAINFGGIGAVIAHEITHGYDDQGRKFDADGNINDWWTEEDAKLFKAKCDLIVAQTTTWTYEDEPAEGGEAKVHNMNGELTMGENLADLGGMSLAFQAFKLNQGGSLTKNQITAFFSSWGNVWKSKETKASIIQALASDPHAPPSFRANLVKNLDEFHEAFGVEEGDPMFLAADKRVKMW